MSRIALAVVFILALTTHAAAQSQREILQRCKAATAYVDLQGKASATAFCISEEGVFVTNDHVVKDVAKDGTVRLVFDPNSEDRREVKAKVLRRAADVDLALLRVVSDKPEKFPAIALGSDSELYETMSLTAFGYPFGKALNGGGDALPDISVNVGRVTSLRKKEGKLFQIQLDAQLNPGNSGGPVIDESGKVVGIATAGVFATGINFAVPVSKLKGLIEKPEATVEMPAIAPGQEHAEADFAIELVPFLRPIDNATVELHLTESAGTTRVLPAKAAAKHRYVVHTSPYVKPDKEARPVIDVVVQYSRGSVAGWVKDQAIQVVGESNQSVQLAQVRAIEFGGDAHVTRHDGQALKGKVEGLSAVQVGVGDYTIELDLAKAKKMTLKPVNQQRPSLQYAWVVKIGEEEILRREGVVAGKGASLATSFKPYEGERQRIDLPDTISDALLAKGGQLLLLQMPKTRKVAVYNINEAKITNYLSLAHENAMLAAGSQKLIVVMPSEGVIERWSLDTFERETTRPLPVKGPVKNVAMGYASQGPLLMYSSASSDALGQMSLTFIDVEKLEPLAMEGRDPHHGSFRDAIHIRASATGDVFGRWCTSHSPQGMQVIMLQGKQIEGRSQHDSAGHIAPNFDGTSLLTGFRGVLTPNLDMKNRSGDGSQTPNMPAVPSTHSRFYVSVPTEPGAQFNLGGEPFKGAKPTLHLIGRETRLCDLPDLELGRPTENYSWSANDFTIDKRVFFIPQANQLLSIPYSSDRLIVQKFDMKAVMEEKNIDYFFVNSTPPRTFEKGAHYQYTLEVMAKSGTPKFELSSGPEGMAISGAGVLSWQVPEDFADKEVNVIVTVQNSDGQTLLETFRISRVES